MFERMLGRKPKGMWPSEMAVGEAVIGLAEKAKLDWMISDEEVLARSLEGRALSVDATTASAASCCAGVMSPSGRPLRSVAPF